MAEFPPLPPPPGGEPEPEEQPEEPKRSRRAPVLVLVGALIATAAGLVIALRGPEAGACETSTVESARFGYCIAAPGWRLTNAPSRDRLPYDQLVRSADASTVRIVAIDLDAGQGLDLVVDTIRSIQTEDAIEVGEVFDRRVAGVRAVQWDVAIRPPTADARRIREVVFVREGTAWRVQLLADAGGFEPRVDDFEAILRSWTFR
jgi:hypothetical protein